MGYIKPIAEMKDYKDNSFTINKTLVVLFYFEPKAQISSENAAVGFSGEFDASTTYVEAVKVSDGTVTVCSASASDDGDTLEVKPATSFDVSTKYLIRGYVSLK